MIFSTKPDKEEFFAQAHAALGEENGHEEEFNSDDLFEIDFEEHDDEEIGSDIEAFRNVKR